MPKVLKVDPKDPSLNILRHAVEEIIAGGLIAYPTDTVYGLGASAFNPKAARRIFEVKKRPLNQPLPLAVSGLKMAERLAYVGERAKRLIKAFWPGALTIVLRSKTIIPRIVTGGRDAIGLRAPNHKVPLSIIKLSHNPLIATSVNVHGSPPCIDAGEIIERFGGKVDLIIDGGPCRMEISTVIDLSVDTPTIIRRGAVERERIERVVGSVQEDFSAT